MASDTNNSQPGKRISGSVTPVGVGGTSLRPKTYAELEAEREAELAADEGSGISRLLEEQKRPLIEQPEQAQRIYQAPSMPQSYSDMVSAREGTQTVPRSTQTSQRGESQPGAIKQAGTEGYSNPRVASRGAMIQTASPKTEAANAALTAKGRAFSKAVSTIQNYEKKHAKDKHPDEYRKTFGAFSRIALYTIAIVSDLAQVILDFFVVGVAVNRIIDAVVAVIFVTWFVVKRITLTDHMSIYISLVGSFLLDEIPGVDALTASLWILDVFYTIKTMDAEDKEHNDRVDARREAREMEKRSASEAREVRSYQDVQARREEIAAESYQTMVLKQQASQKNTDSDSGEMKMAA